MSSTTVDSGTPQAERNDRWSQKIWREWVDKYNRDHIHQPCPPNILQTAVSPTELQPWLIRFITSFQQGQGTAYKPRTLYALLCHLHRHVKVYNPHHERLRFLDRRNDDFKAFRDCLVEVNQHMEEFGVERRHFDVFTPEDENNLWSKSVLGVCSPLQLLHTIYYYNGRNLLLRRGEHQQLRFSQFRRLRSPDRYEFVRIHFEDSSSDQEGEGGSLPSVPSRQNQRKKVTSIMSDPSSGKRCHVYLLDTYFSKIPSGAWKKDHFYLQPIKGHVITSGIESWYTERTYGKNALDKITKCIAANAGLVGHYTATSLQQTGRTNMAGTITHSYKSNISRLGSPSPPSCKKPKIDTSSEIEENNGLKLTKDVPPSSREQPSTLQFSGEFLFHNTEVTVITERHDASSSSAFHEVYMGDCRVTIQPSAPVDLNVMTMLQGLEQGHWQVVMIPPKRPPSQVIEQSSSLEPPHIIPTETNCSDIYSSEDDDDDLSYHCPPPSSENGLPAGTTIFQYVNN